MSPVSLAKDQSLSREQIADIAAELYGTNKRWYSDMARELTDIRGKSTAISAAAVQQWMRSDSRNPPWWATALIYRLLAKRRAELVLRAGRIQLWINELEENYIKIAANRLDTDREN